MFSSASNLTATLKFSGFSSNSLFVSVKNNESKTVVITERDSANCGGKENVDTLSFKKPNLALEAIKRHFQN